MSPCMFLQMLVLGYADPPSEPRQGGMLDRLAGFATDVYSVFTNLTPANIWNGVQNVWDNVTTFVGNVGEQLRDDPVGLVGTIGAGIRDTGMVLANVFTFGLISPLNGLHSIIRAPAGNRPRLEAERPLPPSGVSLLLGLPAEIRASMAIAYPAAFNVSITDDIRASGREVESTLQALGLDKSGHGIDLVVKDRATCCGQRRSSVRF